MTDRTVPTVPDGYRSVSPWVITRDTGRLIEFLVAAFDAEELGRMVMADGSIGHAEARIGDSVVLMFDLRPDWPEQPAYVRLYLPDGDAAFARAIDAGGEPLTEMTEMFWGDRVGRVRDPLGNLWWIHEHVAEPTQDELAARMAEPRFIDAMAYVSGAELVPVVG